MKKEFIVQFYQNGEATLYKGDGSDGETIKFNILDLIKVSEQEMFKWLEIAHKDKIKLSIYDISKVCDLS